MPIFIPVNTKEEFASKLNVSDYGLYLFKHKLLIMKYLILFALLAVFTDGKAQNDSEPTFSTDTIFPDAAHVDFDRFLELATEVRDHRAERLVSWNTFQQMSSEPNTIILDTRSKEMYDRSHIKGAIHLNFADFNVWSLRNIAPDPSTRILIYCNNNFDYPMVNWATIEMAPAIAMPYVSKGTPPISFEIANPEMFNILENSQSEGGESVQDFDLDFLLESETSPFNEYIPADFPLTMALNVPTYINLYGYGYRNVYELADLLSIDFSGVEFEGTDHPVDDSEILQE